jgi:two-component system, cell cycle sensor histidine kinase and response regulator CckA
VTSPSATSLAAAPSGLTLRRFLLGLVALGVVYVGAMVVVLAFRIAPAAAALRRDMERVLATHDAVADRLQAQRIVVARVHLLLESSRAPDTAETTALTEMVRVRLDSVLGISASLVHPGMAPELRFALARAVEVESALGTTLLRAIAALAAGHADRSRALLIEADRQAVLVESVLTRTQRAALADVSRRGSRLSDVSAATARSVGWWLLLGSILFAAGAAAMHARFYAPLRELEVGLARVTAGDRGVTLPIRHEDEIGRLARHLNAMTDVMRRAEVEERTRRERLRGTLAQFWTAQSQLIADGDASAAIRTITATMGPALGVERTSLWLFRDESASLECVDLFELGANHHSRGAVLVRRDWPGYFAALEAERTIAAHEATSDLRTAALTARHLVPLGITAVLDSAVYVRGRLAGVLCFEHVGSARHWTSDEQDFAAAVADLLSLVMEAAERAQAEHAQRELEERFRVAFEQAPVGIVEADTDGRLLRVNPRFCALLGYGEHDLVGRRLAEFLHPDDVAADGEAMRRLLTREAGATRRDNRYVHRSGATVWASVSVAPVRADDGAPRYVVAALEDVTERRTLQAQLVQSQKMESVGRLAGGVAHDFNNLLTAIIGYAETAHGQAVDPTLQADLEEIARAARRGADLTRQLLTFARTQVVEPRIVDINDLIRTADKLLRRLAGASVEVELHLDAQVGAVRIDPSQLEQVLVNLVVNARDAMADGGRVTITTANVWLGEHQSTHRPAEAGAHVEITVADTGTGMDEATLSRAFEPFFTTKEPGRGTGLGLATCYGIVRQAGGLIEVTSELGRGSRFRVILPRAEAPAARPSPAAGTAPAPRGRETVLVVEDDEQIRQLAARTLRGAGYRVLVAADGEEALSAAAGFGSPIDLLLTDVVLPRLGGPEVAARMRAARPDLRVICMSGYTGGPDDHQLVHEAGDRFLPKPFVPSDLLRSVRDVLEQTVGE